MIFLPHLIKNVLYQRGKHVILTTGKHILPIIEFHYPDFHVIRLRHINGFVRYRLMRLYARIFDLSDNSDGLTVFINVFEYDLLKIYRTVHPNKRIVFRIHDIVPMEQTQIRAGLFRKIIQERLVDKIETYCKRDAEIFNIDYAPNRVNVSALKSLSEQISYRSYRTSFIGYTNREGVDARMIAMHTIESELIKLYPKSRQYLYAFTPRKLKQRMLYVDTLRVAAHSEAIIDLIRLKDYEGYSYRIPEALAMGRKIITNRKMIIHEPYYHPSRIFICGVDDWSRFKDFMETDFLRLNDMELHEIDTSQWSRYWSSWL